MKTGTLLKYQLFVPTRRAFAIYYPDNKLIVVIKGEIMLQNYNPLSSYSKYCDVMLVNPK
jgi:hypothetical protein